jgi:hypothetical protein
LALRSRESFLIHGKRCTRDEILKTICEGFSTQNKILKTIFRRRYTQSEILKTIFRRRYTQSEILKTICERRCTQSGRLSSICGRLSSIRERLSPLSGRFSTQSGILSSIFRSGYTFCNRFSSRKETFKTFLTYSEHGSEARKLLINNSLPPFLSSATAPEKFNAYLAGLALKFSAPEIF